MKDDNYSFIKGKTEDEKIYNLKNIITLLSQNLEMDLGYISAEDIINKKDKEQVKYLLVLFINILRMKDLKKEHLINVHFNNQIGQLQRYCLTENEKVNKTESNLNKSFDIIIRKMKNNENTFYELLKNERAYQDKLRSSKKKENQVLDLPTSEDEEKIEERKIISKNNIHFKYFLTKYEVIDIIIKLIKEILPKKKFYEFLINGSFNKKISRIIKDIYILHLEIFKNPLISKQFLIDYIIDIKYIINKELSINVESKEFKMNINDTKIFSKKLRNIKVMKKYYNLNYNKEKKEMKINKLENEYQRKRSYVTIYDYNKFYKKLIHLKKKEDLENLEFQELLFKLKYYKTLKEKESIINVLKKNNNKVKLSKNKFIQ